ncbi:DNA gyrase subunit B [Streptomyces umbrinus]|uniref:DNA topoisomerase (ATP-hydrolyzing) n=1 Tax=Streptomyces umbrinus TaxID=67370 RepID=A0ABU0T956_9ACTN|nr:DNA gyrase subunit B [Streptomyces umbrinus]MDQ1032344.1 DNA gyrase subunit B [Streptomyces umbrinus]
MSGENTGYDAADIEVLEGREAVRKRPGMWVGSTGERGPHHMVFEVVGRAVNQVLVGGSGSGSGSGFVDVTLTPDGGVRVADDGPAGPFEAAGDARGPDLEALLTSFHAGPELSGRQITDVGQFRAGLFVVNALSSRLTAEARGEEARRVHEYARGVEVAPPAAMEPATGSGTTITFWPDSEIFETTQCSFAVLAERFRQVAFLNRGLGISLTDERPAGGARAVSFRFPEGVRDFVAALDAETGSGVQPDVIGFEHEDPRMAGTMEVALLWTGSRKERILGFANSRATREGGTHVDGFRDGVAAAVIAYARERGLPTRDLDPRDDRICRSLTAVVSVKLDHPEFLGATRGLLGNSEVRDCVGDAVREHLGIWFEEEPERAAEFVARILRGIHED